MTEKIRMIVLLMHVIQVLFFSLLKKIILFFFFFIAGKAAMANSPGKFCAAASEAYRKLDANDKQSLQDRCGSIEMKPVTVDVRKAAAKIFRKVESQVCLMSLKFCQIYYYSEEVIMFRMDEAYSHWFLFIFCVCKL